MAPTGTAWTEFRMSFRRESDNSAVGSLDIRPLEAEVISLPSDQPCSCRLERMSRAGRRSGPDDIGRLHHDHVTEELVAEHDLWEHQDIGVAGARVAEPIDLKW
jgi:hypothetical protein